MPNQMVAEVDRLRAKLARRDEQIAAVWALVKKWENGSAAGFYMVPTRQIRAALGGTDA